MGGNDAGWSSATPRNYLELKKLQIWKQTLENQYEYSRAIKSALNNINDESKIELWFEDFCSNPTKYLDLISRKFHLKKKINNTHKFVKNSISESTSKNYYQNFKKIIKKTALDKKKYLNLIYKK